MVDGGLAAFFTVLAQVELHGTTDDGYRAGPLWLNSPFQVVFTLLLLVRSSRPRLTLALMCAWTALPNLVAAHTFFFWGNFLPLLLVNYTVSRVDRGWLGRWSWLVCSASMLTLAFRIPELWSLNEAAFPLVLFGAVSALGVLVRRMADQKAALARVLEELAGQQHLRAEEAVSAERRRIAAEMHDVVAHAVSLMAVQVGAARLMLESSGTDVPPQLRAAEDTGRRAVAELRRTLGLLRTAQAAGDTAPVPDLTALPALVRRFADAGLDIDLQVTPELATADLPASLQLTVYRIVQEGLTNAVKHAGPVAVQVCVARDEDGLTVRVRNAAGATASAASAPQSGHGLTGMRERVSLYRGRLCAERSEDGGYTLDASLPFAQPEPTATVGA